jgi:16S rRNA processing protein RimM
MGANSAGKTPADAERWIDVGAIGKPHGLKGEVVVHYTGDTPARFEAGARVSLFLHGERQTLVVAQTRPMPKKFVVRFEGCARIEDVEPWRGGRLQVLAGELPVLEAGSNYHFELIGLEVMDAGGRRLGRLSEILSTGSNDVYIVRGTDREYLIPAIRDAIEAVDLEAGTMILKDLKGMIEP